MTGGSTAVLALGSTEWTISPSLMLSAVGTWVKFELLRNRPMVVVLCFRSPDMLPRCLMALGLPSMPTEKSQSNSLQSSPTLPKR